MIARGAESSEGGCGCSASRSSRTPASSSRHPRARTRKLQQQAIAIANHSSEKRQINMQIETKHQAAPAAACFSGSQIHSNCGDVGEKSDAFITEAA